MTSNTNENTKDSSIDLNFEPLKKIYESSDLLQGVVYHPNGNFYKIASKDLDTIYLSLIEGNQMSSCPMSMALLNINNGNWKFFEKGDNSWKDQIYSKDIMDYKYNVLKSLIYNQLASEANDNLLGTIEHDNYLKNLIKKANKGLERKATKYLEAAYGADQAMIQNVFNSIDTFVSNLANRLPHEFFYLNSIVEEYNENPAKYHGRKVSMSSIHKQDGEQY